MTVGDIVRKAECSIQLNAGNISLLAVNIRIKGVLEKCDDALKWAKGWGRATLVLSCRILNFIPTKSRFSSPGLHRVDQGLLSQSRGVTEIFFYLPNFSIPHFLHWVESSSVAITYSPFITQVLCLICLLPWGAYWAYGQTCCPDIFAFAIEEADQMISRALFLYTV